MFHADIPKDVQSLLRKAHRGLRLEALRAGAAVIKNYGEALQGSKAGAVGGVLEEAVVMVQPDDLLLTAAALDLCIAALQVRLSIYCFLQSVF